MLWMLRDLGKLPTYEIDHAKRLFGDALGTLLKPLIRSVRLHPLSEMV